MQMSSDTLLIHMTASELQAEIQKSIQQSIQSVLPSVLQAEQKAPIAERPVSYKEICAFLNISERTGRDWIRDKKLPQHHLGGKVYYFPNEVCDLIKGKSTLTAKQIGREAANTATRKRKAA